MTLSISSSTSRPMAQRVTLIVSWPVFPAASVAVTSISCAPLATLLTFQLYLRLLPLTVSVRVPSMKSDMVLSFVVSVALEVIWVVPETVEPFEGR
jgi:hypothetical protein